MERIVHYAIPFALAAVAIVLLAGLWNMLRGGNPNLSQKLMRWRVVLQFIAIIIVMTAIYLGLARGEPVDLHEEYEGTEHHYMLRDIDAVPRVFHADEFFDGVEDARGQTRAQRGNRHPEEPTQPAPRGDDATGTQRR